MLFRSTRRSRLGLGCMIAWGRKKRRALLTARAMSSETAYTSDDSCKVDYGISRRTFASCVIYPARSVISHVSTWSMHDTRPRCSPAVFRDYNCAESSVRLLAWVEIGPSGSLLSTQLLLLKANTAVVYGEWNRTITKHRQRRTN